MPTVYDVVANWSERWPDKLAAISEQDGSRTFGELTERGGRFGVALSRDLGCDVGSRACFWMVNRPEWLDALVAVNAAGIASVPANPEWSDAEIGYVLEHSGSKVLVCDGALVERALALRDRIPTLEHVVTADDAVPGASALDELVAAAPNDFQGRLPNDVGSAGGNLLYTSGTTTGRPKGVVLNPEMLTSGISYEEMFGLGPTDRSIFVTPLFHGNGLGGATSAIVHGGSAVFPRRFSARGFWGLVDRYRPTYLFTLAPVVNILMSLPPSDLERSHSLRVLVVLGAAANAEAIEARFGAPVIDWYGMTEAGMGTYTRLGEPRRPGSAGRVFDDSDMRIVDDAGEEVAVGEVGEVAFRASKLGFTGYLDDEEANAAALRDDWFLTGDLGRMDDDGYFYFVDRKKDIVRRGGENISSMEVEAVLREHGDVSDLAVLGRPDPVLGERVVAFVLAPAGRSAPDAAALGEFARGRLADFKLPEEVIEVDELPRTGTGKIEKFRLRQRFAS